MEKKRKNVLRAIAFLLSFVVSLPAGNVSYLASPASYAAEATPIFLTNDTKEKKDNTKSHPLSSAGTGRDGAERADAIRPAAYESFDVTADGRCSIQGIRLNGYSHIVAETSSDWFKIGFTSNYSDATNRIDFHAQSRDHQPILYLFFHKNTEQAPRTAYLSMQCSEPYNSWLSSSQYIEYCFNQKGCESQESPTEPSNPSEPTSPTDPPEPTEPEAPPQAKLNVSLSSIAVNADGKSEVACVDVDTEQTGGFTVSAEQNGWIKVGMADSLNDSSYSAIFSDSGKFYVFFDPNPEYSPRTQYITVTHSDNVTQQTIEVTQEAAKKQPKLNVEPVSIAVDADGRSQARSINVDTEQTGGFTVSTEYGSWVRIGKSSSSQDASNSIAFNENGAFYVFFDANPGQTPRTQYITITHEDGMLQKTVEVSQKAGRKPVLKVDQTSISVNAKGIGSVKQIAVDTEGTGGFTVRTDSNSWVRIAKERYGNGSDELSFDGSGTFYVFFDGNTSTNERVQEIVVNHSNGEISQAISVRQEGITPILNVGASKKTVGQDGSFYNSYVSVDTKDTGSCTVKVENCSWLRISRDKVTDMQMGLTSLTLSGKSGFYLVAEKNEDTRVRKAVIKISHSLGGIEKTVEVSQAGADPYLEVSREAVYFDESVKAVSAAIEIAADEDTKWSISTTKSWIQITDSPKATKGNSSMEGAGSGIFYILVKENKSWKKTREGYVTVYSEKLGKCEIYVHQEKRELSLKEHLENMTVSVTKATFDKGKKSKVRLSYPEGMYASDVKSVKYSSNNKKVAVVSKTGVIKGKKKGKAVISVKVTVQSGESKTFKLKVTVDKRKIKIRNYK